VLDRLATLPRPTAEEQTIILIDPNSSQERASVSVVPTEPGSGTGHLDRRRIFEAAIALIDRDGLRALTMRKLGSHLGVEGMALYHYVNSREGLLDGIVETVIDGLYGDPDVHLSSPDWPEYLQRLAHGVRRIALAHPEVFPLIATRPPAAPWVRPPLRSLRWMESFLENFERCGFSDRASVGAYQAFSSFLLGHLLLEVAAQGADIGPVPDAEPRPPKASDLSGYPLLERLEPLLKEDRAAEEFEDALEALLDRLEALGKR
jgi:AcrR family transcriptional regulator